MKKIVAFLSLLALTVAAADQPKFELVEGDRVALVGGGFVERENEEGFIETMLTRAFPERHVTFRNLGWSGDTVHSFLDPNIEPRPKYVPTVFDYVAKLKPTVIFVSYGMMESFDDEKGLPQFVKDYNTVLDKLATTTKRVVLISPFHHEKLGGQWPDPAPHNRQLKVYTEAIKKIAAERGLVLVNLFDGLAVSEKHHLTVNGIHLSNEGYAKAAGVMAKQLGLRVASDKFTTDDALREAIKDKNRQWWYHYRPMNSEYVYPGGERYQLKIGPVEFPMFSEIEEFAKRAEQGDAQIAELIKSHADNAVVTNITPTVAEKKAHTAEDPDPEIERATFKVADGFDVQLYASDPMIDKPIQMAFDERGRIWLITTTIYPQIRPGQKQTDKILILEDTDGDGKADKTTVFADNLIIPTGILPTKDGAYVFEDTKLLFLCDTNHDDHADVTEEILSGFGTEDSHHKGHVFRWGPEGNLYFNVGVFLHNTIETAHGTVTVAGRWQPGILQYRPESGKLDIHLINSIPPNPWGHYWNYWGSDFLIDSSGQSGSNFVLPISGRSSVGVPVTGGHGKLAGGEVISGRHFPEEWQGNLIASPFKENRVSRWKFSDDSSGFALTPLPPLIVSTDNSFRPVESRLGPDGALYILDWYNPLIGHMQYHFRDPGRDMSHGRIWRVTAKNRALVPPPKFAGASVTDILEYLKSPEDYTRYQVKRVLTERDPKEVLPTLANWVKNLHADYPEYDHYRMEALWAYESLHTVEPKLLQSLLTAKDANARAAATDVVRRWRDQLEKPLDLLIPQVVDQNPRVRLEAVIGLSYLTDPRAMEVATRVLDMSMDRYLDQALRSTAAALKPIWLPAFTAGTITFDNNPKYLEFVLQAAGTKESVKPCLRLLKEQKLSATYLETAISLIASYGEAEDIAALYQIKLPAESESLLLANLSKAALERKIIPQVDGARLKKWFASKDEKIRGDALRLAGGWKRSDLQNELIQAASAAAEPMRIRTAAIEGLAGMENETSWQALQELTSAKNPADLRFAAIVGMVGADVKKAAASAVTVLSDNLGDKNPAPVFQAFLQHKNGAATLGKAIEQAKINPDNAKLGLRTVQTSGQQDPVLLKALSDAAGLSAETKELTREELLQLVAEVRGKGDAARGEQLFHRDDLNCFKCHAIGGAGGMVGPELGAVGGGSQVEYLIDSVLYPNKVIKDGFEAVEVTTKDDDYYLGIRVRESKEELVLKDATHNELIIPQDKIKVKKNKKVSLMPSGLTTTLTHTEFLDLVRFLSELGKPGPFANNPKALVRRWQLQDAANLSVLIPAYSLVNGDFLPQLASGKNASYARCEIEMTTPGKVNLRLNSIQGLNLSVDDKPIKLEEVLTLDLSRGVHLLKFGVTAARQEPIHAEFEEVAGSPGRFQMVGGP